MYRLGQDGDKLPPEWPTFEDDGKGTYPDELIGEPDDRDELADQNYFRLNVGGMARVRVIALIGADLITVEQALEDLAISHMGKQDMDGMLKHIRSLFELGVSHSEKAEWLSPWCVNGQIAAPLTCQEFALRLEQGLNKLDKDPVGLFDEESLDYYREFVRYLRESPFGMLVG